MREHIEAREVRALAVGRWLDVLAALAPALAPALDRPGGCSGMRTRPVVVSATPAGRSPMGLPC